MRGLHVINCAILAGVEVLIREMVPRQRERGLDVSVAVLKELDSPLERDLRDMGTPFVELPRLNIYDPRHALALRRVVGQYDIVQANLFPAQLWVAAAASDRRFRDAASAASLGEQIEKMGRRYFATNSAIGQAQGVDFEENGQNWLVRCGNDAPRAEAKESEA